MNTGNALLDVFVEKYGPQAFGFLMLLILWQFIIAPQLDSHRLDFESQQDVVASMEKTAKSIEETAKTLKSTAEALGRVCDRLEK